MSSTQFPTRQHEVIATIRRLVDEWRGFELGRAREAYPLEPPRYEPGRDGEHATSETTALLLRHWFRRPPHVLGRPPQQSSFRYWPHQRRLVETFVYLYEVRRIRRTEDLWALGGVDASFAQRDPWAKLGGQLATGSGKTKMMSLLIAWWVLNGAREGDRGLGFGRHCLLIAPGLFVRDRLLADFAPPDGRPSVFQADPVIPPELRGDFDLQVYDPVTCPRRLDPARSALVVTNYHQLLRTSEEDPLDDVPFAGRQIPLLFGGRMPSKLEDAGTPLIERLASVDRLLVLNDEAHHVWDETGHLDFELKAQAKAKGGATGAEDMAWIRSIRALHGSAHARGRVSLQVDLSATLFEESGAEKTTKATRFKPADLFRHTSVLYELSEAIGDGIVKKPILENVEVRAEGDGEPEPLIRPNQPNAWETYRNLLLPGIKRWMAVRDQLRAEGDVRKPILFVLCADSKEAAQVANMLTFGEPTAEDLAKAGQTPTGFRFPDTDELLFVEDAEDGPRSTVVQIHVGQKEERNETDWNQIRQLVNAVDRDEVEVKDERGLRVLVPNPYTVVVSVMMLKEGWDVRNVKVIVPLRPCGSRTLTEQTLGRGLRKMHPPELDEDGRVTDLVREDLYVIEHPSFKAILDQIGDLVEEIGSDDIQRRLDYIGIEPRDDAHEREERSVRLLRFEGLVHIPRDWRSEIDVARIPAVAPRIAWREHIAEVEFRTWLKEALGEGDAAEGLRFSLSGVPSFHDYTQFLDRAYVLPLLQALRVGRQHLTAARGVVRDFLERKTFALPAGVPLSFDGAAGSDGRIALGNLARSEVIEKVLAALRPELGRAFQSSRPETQAQLDERRSADIGPYQAVRRHVLDPINGSAFVRAAMDSDAEVRVGRLLERATDVTGWVYNHRKVGFAIEYDWQGVVASYYPDFVVRARIGEVAHNFLIEVKGRLDDADKAKARRGDEVCRLLTEYDREPWHYLFLLENEKLGRSDISWWEDRSAHAIRDLWRMVESRDLYPDRSADEARREGVEILSSVAPHEEYREALPVYDLDAQAGGYGESSAVPVLGWTRVKTRRNLDRRMFVARVEGHSMEPGVPSGAWCLFRRFEHGREPILDTLDGRRLVFQARDDADPVTGGRYTLKRLRVAEKNEEGGIDAISLQPDNPSYQPIRVTGADAPVRIVAELLDVLA